MFRQLVIAVIASLAAAPVPAQDTIEALVSEAGLREAPIALRERGGWDPSRKVLVRDAGFVRSALQRHQGDRPIVLVRSVEEALALINGE